MPSRSPYRVAVAACATLFLAACGRPGGGEASQVLAKVNDAEISVHQVNFVLQRQPGLQSAQLEAASKQALEQLIDQEIAVQKALKLKLDHEPVVMQALSEARREVLARAYASRVAESAPRPEPAEIRAYYDAKPALFAQRKVYLLQELLVQADDTQIAALRERVGTARSMPEILDYLKNHALSVRTSQTTQPADALPTALAERMAALHDGQAVMMPAAGGARIVFIGGSRPAPVSLEHATPAIAQVLAAQRRRDAVATEMRTLRQASAVKYVGRFSAAPASAPALTVLPSTSPASGASSGDVDAAALNKGLSGLR